MTIEAQDLKSVAHFRHVVVASDAVFEVEVGGDESVVDKHFCLDDQSWHVLIFRARLTPGSAELMKSARKEAEQSAASAVPVDLDAFRP